MDFNQILQKRGIVELIYHIEDTYGGIVTSNEAVQILYQLCKLFTKNNYQADPMLELIVLCCKNINNLKEKEVDPFLMSIYHFVKYFLKQKMFDCVLILCNQVKTHCLDVDIKSDMYGYYVQVFTREIFANCRDYDGDILQETVIFSVKCELLLNKCDLKAFCGRLVSYPLLFRHAHINNAQRNNFCLNFIQTLRNKDLKSDCIVDIYKSFINVFYVTVTGISHCDIQFPQYIPKTLEEIITIMYEIFPNKSNNKCVEILSLFFQTLIQDVKNYNKKSERKLKQLIGLLKSETNDQIFVITCSQIGKMLKILLEYFGRVRENWNDHFPFREILQIFELIEKIVSKNSINVEKCCTRCNLKFDILNSITTSAASVEFLNVIIRQKGECFPQEIHEIVLRIIKECCKNIQTLQRNGCEKYPAFWKFLGLHTYNIGVALYKMNNFSVSKLYTEVFLRNLIQIEGIHKANICYKDALGATLHLHATNCQNLQEKHDAMMYLVITMLLSKEYRKKAMYTWIVVKSDQQSDDEIKAMTVNKVLFSRQNDIKKLIPQFSYCSKSAEELLIFELHYYSENWLSRIPIISCCNELIKVSNSIFVKTKALLLSYDKFLVMFDPQIISSVEATIDSINDKPYNFSHNLCLSLLKFILYQFKFNEIILKNLEDMNRAFIPLKSTPLQPFEEPPNPNDKCDIVPEFINLNLESIKII